MKRLFVIFMVFACAISSVSYGAVSVKKAGVKKASPVATQQADKLESVTSLLPTVVGLVGSVKSLNAQQQQLSADCAPTSSEIETVNELVKEWAKTGSTTAASAVSGLGEPCRYSYKDDMEYADQNETCYDVFETTKSDEAIDIWIGFPKASLANKCDAVNNKNCTTISNIYDVFAKIPFDEEDYTKAEVKKITKLREKMERCMPGKLKAAKREFYGNFLTQALGSVGQSTGAAGTASVLDAVSSLGGSGDIKSMLPSLGQMATQVLDK